MGFTFKKATKSRAKLRLALIGPSGSGKTYSSLAIASGLGDRIAVVDTEHGSASLYADEFGFDVLELTSFSPSSYVDAIKAAESAGYDVVVIDSLSHAWFGKDGALEMVDAAQRRQKTPNSYTAWRDVTPAHNHLVDAIIQSPCHIVATMRAKTDFVQEKDERGKTTIRKVGLAPIQRDGLDYEFTVVGDMDLDHVLTITKSRCKAIADKVIKFPGKDVAATLLAWLNDGGEPEKKPEIKPAAAANANAGPGRHEATETDARVAIALKAYENAQDIDTVNATKEQVMGMNDEKPFAPADRTKLGEARSKAEARIKAAAAA